MASPPKPWELPTTAASAPSASTNAAASTSAPPLPSSSSPGNTATASTSAFGQPSYSAMSPYSRYGTGGMYGGGYGGMGMYGTGGMYGGYGNGMYGGYGNMGGMFGGPMGPVDPNNPSLSSQLESSTAQVFMMLQNIVQTFGSFAQMLESTYMATHSSFFAMVGVAEQLGNLRNALGTVLGLFGLIRWVRDMLFGARNGGLNNEYRQFVKDSTPPRPKMSKKPLIMFLTAVIGLPYAMHKLIKHLAANAPPPALPVDPTKLMFARAAHAFTTSESAELALKQNEIVAVLSTVEPATQMEGEWWRGRTRDGREGWFPKAYVEIIRKRELETTEAPRPKTVD